MSVSLSRKECCGKQIFIQCPSVRLCLFYYYGKVDINVKWVQHTRSPFSQRMMSCAGDEGRSGWGGNCIRAHAVPRALRACPRASGLAIVSKGVRLAKSSAARLRLKQKCSLSCSLFLHCLPRVRPPLTVPVCASGDSPLENGGYLRM